MNLWYKRLGHISRERMEKLIKNEIFSDLDFTDLNICVYCTKGKQTKHTKKGTTGSTRLLSRCTLHIMSSSSTNTSPILGSSFCSFLDSSPPFLVLLPLSLTVVTVSSLDFDPYFLKNYQLLPILALLRCLVVSQLLFPYPFFLT